MAIATARPHMIKQFYHSLSERNRSLLVFFLFNLISLGVSLCISTAMLLLAKSILAS